MLRLIAACCGLSRRVAACRGVLPYFGSFRLIAQRAVPSGPPSGRALLSDSDLWGSSDAVACTHSGRQRLRQAPLRPRAAIKVSALLRACCGLLWLVAACCAEAPRGNQCPPGRLPYCGLVAACCGLLRLVALRSRAAISVRPDGCPIAGLLRLVAACCGLLR